MKNIILVLMAFVCLHGSAQANKPKKITAITYTSPNTFTVGAAISPLSPVVSGGVASSFSISPSISAGLSFSTSTGVISGTPTVAASVRTYTVTASNSMGSKTGTVIITVNPAPVATTTTTSGTTTTGTTGTTSGTTTTGTTGTTTGTTTTTTTTTAPTATVAYTASTTNFSNPERGLYKHTEAHSTSYYPLSQTTLTGYRTNSNITLILRVFYLENFMNGPISSTYLTNMQTDFARIRAAGLKCIVRFAYADNTDAGVPHDASKAIILSHISQLTPILQSNSDVIAVMQAGFIGSYGEWYYTDHFGMNPTATDYANRREVLDALLAAVPNRMAQIRTPALKVGTYSTSTALTQAQAFSTANIARVGHHNDCFLASGSDYGTYKNVSTEYPYLEQETKFLPMGGETCAVNVPRSQCETAMAEMIKFHWSYMNLDYHESVIAGFQTEGCFAGMQNRLGYRFEMVSGTFPTAAVAGTAVPVTLQIKNVGFATPYNQRTAYIVFRNTVTSEEHRVALASDPRLWTAGATTTITENLVLPAAIAQGSYRMFIALPDATAALATRPEYSIRMANNNTWDSTTGYNHLNHTINITSASARVANTEALVAMATAPVALTAYPVPTDNILNLEMENIAASNVVVHNSLGQRISVPTSAESTNRVTLNTQSLVNGIYFVSIGSGDDVQTKRIIVSHK